MGDLSVLGLTPEQERVYVALAAAAQRSPESLASSLDLPLAAVRQAMEKLLRLGLVVPDAGEQVSVSAAPVELVSVVVGRGAVWGISQQLQRSAREEVLTLDRPPYLTAHSEDGVGLGPEQQVRMAGVRYRTVFDQALLDEPGIVGRIRRDLAAGEQGRVLANLPLKLLVVDRTLALLPLPSGSDGDQPAALLIRTSLLVDSFVALFEALWRAAPALRLDGSPAAAKGQEREAQTVVGLLAAGLSDARIALTLGVSERTVRRKIATALDLLGAGTRFQAGLRAKERGWV